MSVYVGVNGVRKQVATPVVGVNGEVRHIVGAYAGVDGEVRRIPAICLIDHVEIQPASGSVYEGTSDVSSNLIGTGLSALTAVGVVAAYDCGIDIKLSTANRCVVYSYTPTVVLKDGCKVSLYKFYQLALPDISFPVTEGIAYTSSASGATFSAVFLGHEPLSSGSVITSVASNSNYIFVALPSSASGSITVGLAFSAATIDGNSVDVYVIEPTTSNVE